MTQIIRPYFKGIEKKLIEHIEKSTRSINIAMAWFTNDDIKESLLSKKMSNPEIEIRILVDENEINEKYFFNTKTKFEDAGILIMDNLSGAFLHHKFMVIDDSITIMGSYNYSKRANTNLENIAVIDSNDFSSTYNRIFNFLTTLNYVDENIQLLFDNPSFAQSILSTYYQFTRTEYEKYKGKIVIGDCYSHYNGLYDELRYYPGLVFNPGIQTLNIDVVRPKEFPLPIEKRLIKKWIETRNIDLILDQFKGEEDQYHLINDELERHEKTIEEVFKRKVENTYLGEVLKTLVDDGIDIIIEDDLWSSNFEPFINAEIVEQLFNQIEEINAD